MKGASFWRECAFIVGYVIAWSNFLKVWRSELGRLLVKGEDSVPFPGFVADQICPPFESANGSAIELNKSSSTLVKQKLTGDTP